MTKRNLQLIGAINFGKSYLDSARFVANGCDNNELQLSFDDPIDFLLGHSIELSLKGILETVNESNEEIRGHNLISLYDKARGMDQFADTYKGFETDFRQFWKNRLRSARDSYKTMLFEGADEEFGVYDNETIGKELPKFHGQLSILNQNFGLEPHRVRYFKERIYQRQYIREFGLNDDVNRVSMFWAAESLYYIACETINAALNSDG